ncbi:MAG: ribonuclease H-like domain-containing protein [Linnemannia elongata]|nr:MAG: ribonuclease H-like domain-containing protein [Linnemannia elongata]
MHKSILFLMPRAAAKTFTKGAHASRGPTQAFYAVHIGKTKGIYFTWPECEKQVKGVIGAKFKKFPTLPEAEEFVKNGPKVYTKPPPKAAASTSKTTTTTTTTTATATTASSSSSSSAIAGSASGVKSSFTRINGITVPSGSDTLVIYTDGSARGNGKVGSQAGLGVFFGVNDPRNLSERLLGEQTNQRAEIMAVYRALQVCGSDTIPVEIRSDSQYTINIVTQWGENWMRNGWKRSDGGNVLHRDIIEPLLMMIKNRPGPIKWVRTLSLFHSFDVVNCQRGIL